MVKLLIAGRGKEKTASPVSYFSYLEQFMLSEQHFYVPETREETKYEYRIKGIEYDYFPNKNLIAKRRSAFYKYNATS